MFFEEQVIMKLILLLILLFCNELCISQEFVYNKKRDVYFFKPKDSKKLDRSISYYDALEYVNSYCKVSDGKLWGVVDEYGYLIIPLEYNDIRIIRDKMFVVNKDNLFGVINDRGEEIFEIKYEKIISKSMIKIGEGYNRQPMLILDDKQFNYNIETKVFQEKVFIAEEEIFKVVENQPVLFAECLHEQDRFSNLRRCQEDAREKWLKPKLAKHGLQNFKAIVQFIVRASSEITDVVVVRTENEKFNNEIIGIVNQIEVSRVGHQRGVPVDVLITFPINY